MLGPGVEEDGAHLRKERAHRSPGQLFAGDEDDSLPWLEADDDYDENGFDGRIVTFGLIALLIVSAAIAGGWLLLRSPDSTAIAHGGTIEAPDTPYKTRPEDPGGSEVAGTGNVSFEVAEGQSREGRLADDAPPPMINIDRSEGEGSGQGEAESERNGQGSAGQVAARVGVGVQLGAFSTRAGAQSAWQQFSARFEDLRGMNYRILEGSADSGTIYRLQAVAANGEAADALCRSIRASGGDCQVKR